MANKSPEHIQPPCDFKTKLNWLIQHYRKPNGDPWSDKEIADAIGSTRGYIYRLRNDPNVNNPSLEIIKKLGKFFGVGLRFFDDDFDSTNISDLYDSVIGTGLSTRMVGLSQLSIEDQATILRIIDNTIKASQTAERDDNSYTGVSKAKR